MPTPTSEQIEKAARAIDPELFSDDEDVAGRRASPLHVQAARSRVYAVARKVLSAAEGVKVRELVWEAGLNDDVFVMSVCGTYSIQVYPKFIALLLPGQKIKDREICLSIDEAKAAAQADFDRRIRSALEGAWMKPSAPITLWAIEIRSTRSWLINWMTIRRTRKEAIAAYKAMYRNPEYGKAAWREKVSLGDARPTRVVVEATRP